MSLGIVGVHPLEKGAMDIREFKARYGHRLCALGNVDLNILGDGTVEEAEVRGLIGDHGPDHVLRDRYTPKSRTAWRTAR